MTVVVVGSTNPVKIRAVEGAFRRLFRDGEWSFDAVEVPSGVAHQPRSDEEALSGAERRAANAMASRPEAGFWVGIEGAVVDQGTEMASFAWIVVLGSSPRMVGKGRTGTFFLPRVVADLVRQGLELGDADDVVFGRINSKQQNGAVGILTGDALSRTELYEQGVLLALIPFKNDALYAL